MKSCLALVTAVVALAPLSALAESVSFQSAFSTTICKQFPYGHGQCFTPSIRYEDVKIELVPGTNPPGALYSGKFQKVVSAEGAHFRFIVTVERTGSESAPQYSTTFEIRSHAGRSFGQYSIKKHPREIQSFDLGAGSETQSSDEAVVRVYPKLRFVGAN